ncbi:hypothetical protein TL16_g02438 [Triparma laevis f. inornata]|uniref:Dynein heavy chain, cytoplasmic n=1 Tax=Triparma laevis f. inornata TaxID=1714386 RepID=A0A9W6ZXF3_9STRA|nr:hypothetical protein TL16_g02438 [Triparma laevis f. inornata]
MGDEGEDVRLEFVFKQVQATYKNVNMEKFEGFCNAEGTLESVYEFLDGDLLTLYFSESRGTISLKTQPPGTLKSVHLFLTKAEQKPISDEFYRSEIIQGDLTSDALEHMSRIAVEVYLPLLTNEKNQDQWSEMVAKDVTETFSEFVANVQITQGNILGTTTLPLPPQHALLDSKENPEEILRRSMSINPDDNSDLTGESPKISHKDRVHQLESCLITWTKQIKSVLKREPEQLLSEPTNPGPLEELDFWKSKSDNLNSIFSQLQSERVRRLLRFLDQAKSTYNGPFAKLCKEVFQSRAESSNNTKFLKPLRGWFEKLEDESDFPNLVSHFTPIMHLILLVWKGSAYYNTPGRLVVLIRELCNTLIRQAQKYINGSRVFEMIEQEECRTAIDMLHMVVKVFGKFKASFFEYKAKANAECPNNQWRMQNNAVFVRLDAFLERCHDIWDLTRTIMQFTKLAKIEVGGTKGKTLSTSVNQISFDFNTAVEAIKGVDYDIMDLDAKQFEDAYYEFRGRIKELERRLGSVITQGFDDCSTVTGRFKLLDSFDSLVLRPVIADDLEKKHGALISSYAEDVTQVLQIFIENKNSPPIGNNLPPIAGALTWCRGLLERVRLPMEKMKNLDAKVLDREDAREVVKMYTSLLGQLADFERIKIEAWGQSIEESSQAKLKNPLLRAGGAPLNAPRGAQPLLHVNFDPLLTRLLREVKYFLLLGLQVPESALEIYQRGEVFRRHMGNLDLIVNVYNKIQYSLLPVERPLLRSQLDKINKSLAQGIDSGSKKGKSLNWKSNGIDNFITEAMSEIRRVDGTLGVMKSNLRRIETLLESWTEKPLFERTSKTASITDFEILLQNIKKAQYHAIKEGGQEVHKLLKDTNRSLKVSQGLPDWKAYVDFINSIIVGGLIEVVTVSLNSLENNLDNDFIVKNNYSPLLEIDLDLYDKDVIYHPEIRFMQTKDTSKFGLRNLMWVWISGILGIGGVFKRLDGSDGSYRMELQTDPAVTILLAKINKHMHMIEVKSNRYRRQFSKYEYLWSSDLHELFREFLASAIKEEEIQPLEPANKGEEELDDDGNPIPNPAKVEEEEVELEKRQVLDLSLFDEKIKQYLHIQDEIEGLKHVHDMEFLRINGQPIKQAMGTWVTKWMYLYTGYIQKYITEQLQDMNSFQDMVNLGLDEDPSSSKEVLMRIMGYIRDVRKKMPTMAGTFGPLRDMVMLLKSHGITLDLGEVNNEPAVEYLERAPMLWDNIVNKTFRVKEEIHPLQNAMVDSIRKDIAAFKKRVGEFSADFKTNAPFNWGFDKRTEVYQTFDIYFKKLSGFEKEASDFNELEELFELSRSRSAELVEMRSELMLLKTTWDMANATIALFKSWQQTTFATINSEDLLDEVKLLQNQIKRMPRQCRAWGVYNLIFEEVQNMAVVLPLVHELHSPSMRDRHWKQLSIITHKHFEKTPQFCLQDLLSLELHNCVEGVLELVEISVKELKVEKKLTTIEDTWTNLQLGFTRHKDTEVFVIGAPDEVLEQLEANQMDLQSMASMGKFVDFFRDKVVYWQSNLSTVETVLKLMLTCQRGWTSLEAIFLASQDIRAQLPVHTKNFENVDNEFKELMKDASVRPGVVECCSTDGREQSLSSMSKQLESCQKALNEYLDTKKNIFPRFYFVSNTALLDILSNGNNPPKIMPHLGSIYDGIGSLSFVDPEEEEKPEGDESSVVTETVIAKVPEKANAMNAKDGESVQFEHDFKMTGAVENWLNKLTSFMQNTLRSVTEQSLKEASNWDVDNPREEWLFNYPGQIALLACQVLWTEETTGALEEYENGQEDAVKKYYNTCLSRLESLIKLVQGDLKKGDRTKIIVLITIDVHSRDVVEGLIAKRVDNTLDFAWQSQLKFYWIQEKGEREVSIRICDFHTNYSFEYVGNIARLVITPLTDRCYVTLTTALRLYLGGAPAGPAGTGKTETTKDLARALGLPCYVFNCSDQMNYQTMADIFKGLAQVGAWGCFDEFNRIMIEVLSVVASQVKYVLDAVVNFAVPGNREKKYANFPAGTPPTKVGDFDFFGETVSLVPTCGFFITMNPGYAGRTELPENLKAQFRSCAMIRPDLKPICENMLMSEGFIKARPLAIKFVTLYELSAELLSKQAHYDWGLRAVKSVLRVAGNLKREDTSVDEDAVLMRALRDFNTPKIPNQDSPIFLRLIADLFPGLDIPPKINESLKDKCVSVCEEMNMQHDGAFVQKVTQFQELLDVRHSVMLLGPAGAGKTSVWKALQACWNQNLAKPTCVSEVVNPKAVTSDELYGYMTLAKDWKDGVLSIVMRNMCKCWAPYTTSQEMQWVVLDGDIDAVWIESMNTVMDDNKVLTLVSNERIPLTDPMRMIFEIHSLKNATPATVSRAGILYLNENDIGYQPFIESWIAARGDAIEKSILPSLFSAIIPAALAIFNDKSLETLVEIRVISVIQTICYLLEGMLGKMKKDGKNKDSIEKIFLYCAMWSFGGMMSADRSNDAKKKFSNMWKGVFKAIKYPDSGTVFDFFVDPVTAAVTPWADKVESFSVGDGSFANIVVPTVDLTRLTYLTDVLLKQKRHVLFVGGAGTGKTALVKDYLRNLDEGTMTATINMNYYTDSASIQQQLEQPIDKRSGKSYGPPTGKTLLYFVDDLNMAMVETYGTQTPIELVRQHMDYGSWYDRVDLGLKKNIQDVQFISCMNNKSGSFFVNPRLQRHFSSFACALPSEEDLTLVYGTILENHLRMFQNPVQKIGAAIVDATITAHKEVSARFLPSAVKFHYNFNMRDLSAIIEGLVMSKPEYFSMPLKMCRLWMHECTRVFTDRLVSNTEMNRCLDLLQDVAKRFLDQDPEELFAAPNIFTSFATSTIDDQPAYLPISDMPQLKSVLEEKLAEYNESNPIMELVLFEQAMEHVTRIARIVGMPGGNALLVGVGGSGKQSLAKLASFICGYSVYQISVTSDYGVADLKEELKELYKKAGVKPAEPMVFMMTDSQIVDERFLVYVNDLLSSGVIPDLFLKDEYDAIFGALRNVAKAAGVQDTRDAMMEFFIDRVKTNLHVILCFSPVGELFRIRPRRFPGLINCTSIDWFHAWPKDALVSVAQRFLEEVELATPEIKENICYHVAEVHLSVNAASVQYLAQERRYNYTTPKSFLELIGFYKSLLGEKRKQLGDNIERLDTGLKTLQNTNKDVEQLKKDLVLKMVEVDAKKEVTDNLLKEMGLQRTEAEAQQEIATVEKKKADKAAGEAAKIEAQADGDLKIAKPALDAANDAVNCLDKNSLTELKGFSNPPTGVDKITQAVLIMIKGEKKNFGWDNAKKMMAKVDAFLDSLQKYRGEDIPEDVVKRVQPLLADPVFKYEVMKGKSLAAANLCNWVINIISFNQIYKKVKPLMASLEEARAVKAAAEEQLAGVVAVMQGIEEKLNKLQSSFLEATEAKKAVEDEANACQDRLDLAERLTTGLSSENVRWSKEIDSMKRQEVTMSGNVLLSAAFVSYVGAFGASFREMLWKNTWLPDLISREIPLTEGIDPLNVLTNDAKVANWQNEGLPADRISVENGAIINNAERWPLIIDPQLQGIKWIRKHEEAKCAAEDSKVIVMQLGSKSWMTKVTAAVEAGDTVIIENLGESIDAVLDPILMRSIYKKGKNMFIKLGGEETQYDPQFRLYLQTKLSNPHYKPEIAAQCTLINFIVTEKGLEDQLLAKVVGHEQPALEKERNDLVQAFNKYKIQLQQLEDDLLFKLANAPADILSDIPLIEGLEATKDKAVEINLAVRKGKETEIGINEAREVYRPVSSEASMLYFMLLKLCVMDHMYQYSLDSFTTFFMKALGKAAAEGEGSGGGNTRVNNLIKTLRWTIFTWVSRGLFEKHKLTFLAQLTFGLMARGNIGESSGYDAEGMNFLMKGTRKDNDESPLEWLPDNAWNAVRGLSEMEGWERLAGDIEENGPRFLEWFNLITPEEEKLPLDWRELDKNPFKKLMVVKCLRPDRTLPALRNLIVSTLPDGKEYVMCDSKLNSFQILEEAYDDSTPSTPIYFVLSPGADVASDVDKLAKQQKMVSGESYFNISLGQGQDIIATERLDNGHKMGHFVVLNNVHLMPRWLKVVEKKLDEYALTGSHENFRIFLSSDPSKQIPIGLIERCIKLTNDPPSGLKANLIGAISSFSKEDYEDAEPRTRGILFGLCYFHAVVVERKKFGGIGYNMMYPFALGDLRDSAKCLNNYMENAPTKIPWADLRYIFGEIMYGGHIVNDFDRLMAEKMLEFIMKDELLDEMPMFPYGDDPKVNFKAPSTSLSFNRVLEHVETEMNDSPLAFGLHTNAEIGFRTKHQNTAEAVLQDILDLFKEVRYSNEDVVSQLDEVGPYQNVFLQECERMNTLLIEVCESLEGLNMGFKGELTMTDAMEKLQNALYLDTVPATWMKLGWPSMRSLSSWLTNANERITQLSDWVGMPADIPAVTWLGGLFNPQSFLTAIMQVSAQAANLELDRLSIVCEVSKKMDFNDVTAPSRDGAFVHGLHLEGARWNLSNVVLEPSLPREMFCPLPVMNCKAAIVDRQDQNTYMCPVYKTRQRGPTFVFSAQLRSKSVPAKWCLAGVAILLDIN